MDIQVRQATDSDFACHPRTGKGTGRLRTGRGEFIATLEEYQRDFSAGGFQAKVPESEGKVVSMASIL
ncbi:MAG: hypothetical protein IPJ00_21005 [Saprospirales bacterium]|nr:hypothetical protein [Saprospirales bacterium]